MRMQPRSRRSSTISATSRWRPAAERFWSRVVNDEQSGKTARAVSWDRDYRPWLASARETAGPRDDKRLRDLDRRPFGQSRGQGSSRRPRRAMWSAHCCWWGSSRMTQPKPRGRFDVASPEGTKGRRRRAGGRAGGRRPWRCLASPRAVSGVIPPRGRRRFMA